MLSKDIDSIAKELFLLSRMCLFTCRRLILMSGVLFCMYIAYHAKQSFSISQAWQYMHTKLFPSRILMLCKLCQKGS